MSSDYSEGPQARRPARQARPTMARPASSAGVFTIVLALVAVILGVVILRSIGDGGTGTVSPAALVTVAPPVQRFPLDGAADPGCPWLVVQGGADELVDYTAVVDWATTRAVPPRVALLPGASHFFHGRLGELQSVVRAFLGEGLEERGE